MKSFSVLLIMLVLLDYGTGKITTSKPRQSTSVQYLTKQNQPITISIMFHMDPFVAAKLAKQYSSRTRRKLKEISRKILMDVRRFFQHRSLNQTIRFKLIDTRFIRNNDRAIKIDENASNYLKSYCDWQYRKKTLMKRQFYSVLLTGLDVFFVNNRGDEVRRSTGRSYMTSMCNTETSCTLIEWHPKNIGFLLAHEIAHSMGVSHDGLPYNECGNNHIMSSKYNGRSHPKTWSVCSQRALKRYLQSDRSWCVKPEYNG